MSTRLPRALAALVIGVVAGANGAAGAAADADASEAGFATAVVAPVDVTTYVHIRRADELRRAVATRPAGAFLGSLVTGQLGAVAWKGLADDLGMEREQVFDRYLGRSATLLTRPGPAASEPTEWVLLTRIDQADVDLVLQRLAPRIMGGGWYELTRQDVVFAWRPPYMLLSASSDHTLAREVDALLRGEERPSLASTDVLAAGRRLLLEDTTAAPSLELVLRHGPPMGGASVLTAALVGERIVARHGGTFEHEPFRHAPHGAVMDISVLRRFMDSALVAMVEPVDRSGARRDPMMASLMPGAVRTRKERENLGDRRVVIVGEAEGRLAPKPFDMAYPTIAVAVEVRDPDAAVVQQDRLVAACMAALSRRMMPDGRLPAAMPNLDVVPADGVRSVELASAARAVMGDHPLADTIGLHWNVINGHGGSWQVFASDGALLRTVTDDLEASRTDAPERGSWEMAGTANGPRVASHLRSWAPHARFFVPGPEDADDFRASLDLLADFAAGFERVRWRLARPADNRVLTELELDLAPGLSAGGIEFADP